jgi:hypothetical protein
VWHERHDRNKSPAIPFLLLLAIADDAFGLVILAVFYPSAPLAPFWLAVRRGTAGSSGFRCLGGR